MKKSKRKYFDEQLARLNERQKRFLYKRAANFRKAAQITNRDRGNKGRKQFNAHGADEKMIMFDKPKKVETFSLDDWALKVLEEEGINYIMENCPVEHFDIDYGHCKSGIVVVVGAGSCIVRAEGSDWNCILSPDLSMTQKSDIAIGDIADFAFARDKTPVVAAVRPRKSKLSRPDPTRYGVERVVAANVDLAVIVAAIKRPTLRPSLVDRYMIAAQKGGIEPLICVNKIDLLCDEDKAVEMEVLEPYYKLGITIIECSVETNTGIDELVKHLKGKLCVFVGHSGTGKTSILNSIKPQINAEVGEVHEATGLGRHTTTSSILYEIDGDIKIIDTPGIREFGLWEMNPDALKWYFDEFDNYAGDCRYANCSHTHEPNCAVKDAVEKGLITTLRYGSYLRILDTIPQKSN